MRTVGYLLALCGASVGCGTKIAQTTYDPSEPAVADAALPPKAMGTCGPTLRERLTVTTVDVDDDIRYERAGYGGVPRDERVAFGILPDGTGRVAWLDNAVANVHVTPLTADMQRAGDDQIVAGFDLGGLVAHDGGFAVLTRRSDPGEPIGSIPDAGAVAPAAFLVRVQDGRETFAAPLTGTLNITDAPDNQRRDCSPGLFGKLAFNGSSYGAYFNVRGCEGDFWEGSNGDKLVYADTQGRFLPNGWTWGCSQNLGSALVPEEEGEFTAFCLSDTRPGAGLHLVEPLIRILAHEFTTPGYSGGELGSAMKLADGRYFVAWASRGVRDSTSPIEVAMESHDIGFVVVSRDHLGVRIPSWLLSTPNVDEFNVHAAPYGRDRVLVTWETVINPRCSNGVCLGPYGGTHIGLFSNDGKPDRWDETVQAPPNGGDDIVVFPNGDLGWAFVADARDSSALLSVSNGVPNSRPIRRLSIARFALCPD
jgi:hypothetical protein